MQTKSFAINGVYSKRIKMMRELFKCWVKYKHFPKDKILTQKYLNMKTKKKIPDVTNIYLFFHPLYF